MAAQGSWCYASESHRAVLFDGAWMRCGVYLGQDPPEFGQFGLQSGSVLVWDPSEQLPLHFQPADGIIAYPAPLRELNAQYSQDPWGKVFVRWECWPLCSASPRGPRGLPEIPLAPRLFDSGYQFASRSLVNMTSIPFRSTRAVMRASY